MDTNQNKLNIKMKMDVKHTGFNKTCLLILLLFGGVLNLYSQSWYEITFNDLQYRVSRNVANSTSSNLRITLYYNDGSEDELYYRPIGDDAWEDDYDLDPIWRQKMPSHILVHMFVHFRPASDVHLDEILPLNGCLEDSSYEFVHHDGGFSRNLTFKYSA